MMPVINIGPRLRAIIELKAKAVEKGQPEGATFVVTIAPEILDEVALELYTLNSVNPRLATIKLAGWRERLKTPGRVQFYGCHLVAGVRIGPAGENPAILQLEVRGPTKTERS